MCSSYARFKWVDRTYKSIMEPCVGAGIFQNDQQLLTKQEVAFKNHFTHMCMCNVFLLYIYIYILYIYIYTHIIYIYISIYTYYIYILILCISVYTYDIYIYIILNIYIYIYYSNKHNRFSWIGKWQFCNFCCILQYLIFIDPRYFLCKVPAFWRIIRFFLHIYSTWKTRDGPNFELECRPPELLRIYVDFRTT